VADHFYGAIAGLGLTFGASREDSPCGGLGVDSVSLAVSATQLPVNPTDLDDVRSHRD
jgi:hypothetical protein